MVIGAYIFYNLIYALTAYPMGIIADKVGLKKIFLSGLIIFSIVYFGMALSNNLYIYFALFFLYGLYAAATEGISKAWISLISDKKDTATAIGSYSGFQSIFAMLASTVTGLVWYSFGSATAFTVTAIVTFLVFLYFLSNIPDPRKATQ